MPRPRSTVVLAAVFFAFACNGALSGNAPEGNAPDSGGVIPDGGDGSSSSRVPNLHRPVATPCSSARGPGQVCVGDGGVPPCVCNSDSDCTQGADGRCLPLGDDPCCLYECSYDQCFADTDCFGGAPCECRGSTSDSKPNVCVPGSQCHIDSDCGPGGYCSPSFNIFCGDNGYFCHTSNDLCVDDSDCTAGNELCGFDGAAGHWACASPCPYPP